MLASRQKFGKFVLLESIDTSGLGSEARAARLGPGGLEKIVTVLQLSPAISANAEVSKRLMEEVTLAAEFNNPNIVSIHGLGRVNSVYYISYEFVAGKSLKEILERCRRDGFPLSADHSLLIASKVCSAFEYAHGRRRHDGARYSHGLLTPSNVLVSYEGEVRVRGFGYWPSRIREAGVLRDEDIRYLAPEQHAGGMGDTRSDVYAVGAILFELLTGQSFFSGRGDQDLATQLSAARLRSPVEGGDSLPKPLTEILRHALAEEPAQRFAEIQDMRKEIDIVLFSGSFTPTRFNLALLMRSLFREDMAREASLLKEEKDSFHELLIEEATRNPGAPSAATEGAARHAPTRGMPPLRKTPPARGEARASSIRPRPPQPKRIVPPKDWAGGTFPTKLTPSRIALLAGSAALIGVGYYFGLGPGTRSWRSPPATLTPEALALRDDRVKELEEKVASLEARAAAEADAAAAKAAEDAKQRLVAQAAARGKTVDPTALVKAQTDARTQAQAEQQQKLQVERRKLAAAKAVAAETQRSEEQRTTEQPSETREPVRVAAATPTPAPAPAPTATPALAPTPTPTPVLIPATPAPATPAPRVVTAGSLVELTDPGVIAPVVQTAPLPTYPPLAFQERVQGTVELNVLVDENGRVRDAQVITGAGGKTGLNEAAIESVMRRRYRPAVKDGVPVKVWIRVRVKFELPR